MTKEKTTTDRLWAGFGFVLVTPLFALASLRLFAHDAAMPLIWANMFTLYLYLPAYLVFVLSWRRKHRALITFSGGVVLAHLVWVAPDFAPSQKPSLDPKAAQKVKVFSANLLMVNPDPRGIIAELLRADADVLLFQEYSPLWERALFRAGVPERYPHSVHLARQDSFGTAIYSRLPLSNARVIDVHGLPMSEATLTSSGRTLQLLNVHTLPPRTSEYTEVFIKQMKALASRGRAADANQALAMIGDFNVTQHAATYGALLDAGSHAAHRVCGRGWATSFPNGVFPLPPVRLDHAFLFGKVDCTSIQEGQGSHSDHRPLVLELLW